MESSWLEASVGGGLGSVCGLAALGAPGAENVGLRLKHTVACRIILCNDILQKTT